MYIKRDQLLNKLIRYRRKDIVKVITGIRRCGKSVLLNELYYDYLLSDGVSSNHIIKVSLDLKKWEALRNGDMLYHYIADAIHDDELSMGLRKLSIQSRLNLIRMYILPAPIPNFCLTISIPSFADEELK